MNLKPIIPFEPISSDIIPRGDRWIAQVKWDGVRILTYYDGHEVRLFNRRQNERTLQYPEFIDVLRHCTASSMILDGEIIALSEGKPSFRKIMKRDSIRRHDKVKDAKIQVPATYMIFDILYYNGDWITAQPLYKRQEILEAIIIPQENLQLVESFTNMDGLFSIIKAKDMEGIVCKQIDSPYLIGKKDNRWQKIKNYKDLIALIGGITLRDGIVNALLLGLYDEKNRFIYIGHVGTGKLSHDDWKTLTENISLLIIDQRPFFNEPERFKEAVWIKPVVPTKIRYIEWTKGRILRQPSIQAFVNISPEECTFKKQL